MLATMMLGWIVSLTQREASRETLVALGDLAKHFRNDAKYDIVRMKQK